jgi:hypothetical protein
MKHHILEVSLAVLIGATCLDADSWKTCTNGCDAALETCKNGPSGAVTVYNQSVQTYLGYYNTCINPLNTTGKTYGNCLNVAYNKDCLPLVNGNCNNSTAWGNDYTACGNQFLGPNGTCANVQTTEVDLAYQIEQSQLSQCNIQNGECQGACPSAGTCTTNADCNSPNVDSGVDQGPLCDTGASPPSCVAPCTTNFQCNNSSRPICNTSSGLCVAGGDCDDPSDPCYGEDECCGDGDGGGGGGGGVPRGRRLL